MVREKRNQSGASERKSVRIGGTRSKLHARLLQFNADAKPKSLSDLHVPLWALSGARVPNRFLSTLVTYALGWQTHKVIVRRVSSSLWIKFHLDDANKWRRRQSTMFARALARPFVFARSSVLLYLFWLVSEELQAPKEFRDSLERAGARNKTRNRDKHETHAYWGSCLKGSLAIGQP